MLNTQKLLYILPDVTYVAELLPTKKEHTFSVQSFRQINGQFLDDENLIPENVEKLFSKIDAESYHLILPDFLFTNTIVEVKETQEAKVKSYIKDELLPDLGLSKDTHEIETFILTQYNGVSKVQLTALERAVLDPIVTSAKAKKIEISAISPLSWTIKSIVSLEPSITAIQIGNRIYLGEHYIGVDQCTDYNISEIESAIETIKTLKGSQPSIQTIYLLTNELVEEKLKENASSTLPIQQLASFKENDAQMPSYVKQIIESGMKTIDISDYPVPKFALPKQPTGLPLVRTAVDETILEKETEPTTIPEAELREKSPEKASLLEQPQLALIPPVMPDSMPLPVVGNSEMKTEVLEPPTRIDIAAHAEDLDDETLKSEVTVSDKVDTSETAQPLGTDTSPIILPASTPAASEILTRASFAEKPSEPIINHQATNSEDLKKSEPDLRQFAGPATGAISAATLKPSLTNEHSAMPSSKTPLIIKNKSSTGSMLKMIFITLAVFCATVAVGVGIGLGVLSFTNRSGDDTVSPVTASPTPIVEIAPSPVPSPSPVASGSASIAPNVTSVLVVNATTTAGYAGSTKSKLDAADYKTVRAANAKGEYEEGTYVLMKTEDPALEAQLEKDTGLTLNFATGYATEDPRSEYSAVIVLAE